ncbi:MAG: DUF3592 domain-containing protein [Akkermansiaceae bacterium]
MEEKSKAGSYYLAGIGLAVALVGAVFVYLLWNSYQKASATREWTETPCLVIRSKVAVRSSEHISKEYSWNVEYLYEFGGESYSSKFHTPRRAKWSSTKESVDELIERYPADEKAVCFVNPEAPSQAILEHDSKAGGYSIWFPMLFVVGGLGITFSSLRGLKSRLIPC